MNEDLKLTEVTTMIRAGDEAEINFYLGDRVMVGFAIPFGSSPAEIAKRLERFSKILVKQYPEAA